jgi:hypothetical protein
MVVDRGRGGGGIWPLVGGGLIATILLGCSFPASDCTITFASGERLAVQVGQPLPADAEVVVAAGDIDPAGTAIAPDDLGPVLNLALRPPAAERLEAYTTQHLGEVLLITVDGMVAAAPVINEPILGGIVSVSGPGNHPAWADQFAHCVPVEILGGG